MKKISISSKCVACGACSISSRLIKESADGKASPVGAGIIPETELNEILKIAEECPGKAISVINAALVDKTGKDGLLELKKLIFRECGNYTAPMPAKSIYSYNRGEYSISIPNSSNERRYEYKSSGKAEEAGHVEFDRIMYSQRKALVQQLVVQYKNKKLTQFFSYIKQEGNYYYDIISRFQNRFEEYIAEAKELSGNRIDLPVHIADHNIEPSFRYNGSTRELDNNVYQLINLEKLTGVCDFITEQIQSLYDYYIDTDDREVYDGNKEKTMWCYILNDPKKELANDIMDETSNYLVNSIKDIVEMNLKNVMSVVNDEINEKIGILLKAIDKAC